MKININSRCPLADECERKRCDFVRHELDCPYYDANGIDDNTIEDQEEIRTSREMSALEASWLKSNEEDSRPEIEYLPVALLRPHPDNPRKDLGDVTELAQSIKANGIYQNLTVIPSEEEPDAYTVIIGHRRLAAAKAAGLTEVPCIITDMSRKEQLATMLLENMQRSDLTVYEQAQGFQLMLDLGETVETIAKQSGFSETTVRRRVKMMELDQDVLKSVSTRQLSLSDFDQLAQVKDLKQRNLCLQKIGTPDFNFQVTCQLRKQRTKEYLPEVKKFLREIKAKGIPQGKRYSGEYDQIGNHIYIYDWGAASHQPPKCKGQLYYYMDPDGCQDLRFYQQAQRQAPKKRSDAEIQREHQVKAAWEQIKQFNEVAYQLRWDFIREQHLCPQNSAKMMKAAMVSVVLRNVDYNGPDRELCLDTLGLDSNGSYSLDRAENALKAFENLSAKKYPLLIYSNFGDSKTNGWHSGYEKKWPSHHPNTRLNALYDWLTGLGYVMSSEELAMQNGTHTVFQDPEEEE